MKNFIDSECEESHEAWMKWKRAKIQARDLMFKENNHHHHTPKTGMSARTSDPLHNLNFPPKFTL